MFPVRAEKKARRVEDLSVYVFKCGEKYAIEKRPPGGLLAGLWGFPIVPLGLGEPYMKQGSLLATKKAKHIFTHVEWRMTGYLIKVDRCEVDFAPTFAPLTWATPEEIKARYAIPSAFRAFKEWIE